MKSAQPSSNCESAKAARRFVRGAVKRYEMRTAMRRLLAHEGIFEHGVLIRRDFTNLHALRQ